MSRFNFDLSKVSKMTCLKICISPVMKKLETQIWTAGKPHLKGTTGYSAFGVSDVVTS